VDAAAGAVVDGGGDGGIDAVYHSEATNIVWVVQSKFIRNGRGEPDLGSVVKFKVGLENLLQGRFEAFQAYKGNTAVNEQIAATVRDEPRHFFYLNNGLTAYCERLEVRNIDRANYELKHVRAFGLSIVNGAQTFGSIADYFAGAATPELQGFVFLKLISLERCEDDRGFAERITRSTNFQNQIGAKDFAALDKPAQASGQSAVWPGAPRRGVCPCRNSPCISATNRTWPST